MAHVPEGLTVKEPYSACKTFECPRFLTLCDEKEPGKPTFTEGGLAYTALVHCNNWTLGLSDGTCPINPEYIEELNNAT